MDIAVIVTTYNRPDALAAVLEGYRQQSDRAFELVVADDGSTEETRRVVERYSRSASNIMIRHVWQEDCGFRAAAARNRAVAATAADYLLFTDGDCVPARGFVAAHRRLAARGYFLAANRVLLGADITRRILGERIPVHEWGWQQWAAAWFKRDVDQVLPLLWLPEGSFRTRAPQRWRGVETCNLSVWREDLRQVNGFDESYQGWGAEDSDLVLRLLHAGVRHKSARFAAPVFHLWHAGHDRSRLAENRKRLEELLASDRIRAQVGLDQYLAARALASGPAQCAASVAERVHEPLKRSRSSA